MLDPRARALDNDMGEERRSAKSEYYQRLEEGCYCRDHRVIGGRMIVSSLIIIVVMEMIDFNLCQNVIKSNRGPLFRLHSNYLSTYVFVGGWRAYHKIENKCKTNQSTAKRLNRFGQRIFVSNLLKFCNHLIWKL